MVLAPKLSIYLFSFDKQMKIDLKHTQIELRSDGIVQINASDFDYSFERVVELNKALGEITKGERKLVLIISCNLTNVSKEAREYMATPESTQFSIAEAFVIRSLGQKILANFYMKVNKPTVLTKIFTSEASAERWLLSLKET